MFSAILYYDLDYVLIKSCIHSSMQPLTVMEGILCEDPIHDAEHGDFLCLCLA